MNGKRDVSEEVADLLTKSMSALDEATTATKSDGYEVISVKPTLPPRPSIPRFGNIHLWSLRIIFLRRVCIVSIVYHEFVVKKVDI